MYRIVITGSYSSGNKGDAAMVIAVATALRQRLPELTLTAAVPFPEQDGPLYEPYGVHVIKSTRRQLARCLLDVLLGGRLSRKVPLTAGGEKAAIENADLVIDLSGDGFNEDYGPHVVLSHLYPVWLAVRAGRPVMLCSQTIGPFRHTRPLATRVLKRVSAIGARDEFTRAYLEQLGVPGALITQTADVAGLLKPACGRDLDEAARGGPDGFWQRPVMGVTVSRLCGNRVGRAARGGDAVLSSSLREALRRMIDRHGVSVLFVVHNTGPRKGRDDGPATAALMADIDRPGCTHRVRDEQDPVILKGLIGRCDQFLATRLHSAVAALSQGVPVVVIGYGPKARGALERWGQTDCLLPVEEVGAESLQSLVEDVWGRRGEIAADLERRRPDVLRLAERNIERAVALLTPGPS